MFFLIPRAHDMVTELPSGAALVCITTVLLPATGWYPGNLDVTGRVCRAIRLLEVEGNECVRLSARPSGSVFLWVPSEKLTRRLGSSASGLLGRRVHEALVGDWRGAAGEGSLSTGRSYVPHWGSALGSSGRQCSTQTQHCRPLAWRVGDEHFIHQLPALIEGSFWGGG